MGRDGPGHAAGLRAAVGGRSLPRRAARRGKAFSRAPRRSPRSRNRRSPCVEAGVAQPVEIEVVAGGEAAQIDRIAMRAAFARVQRDPRHVLERVLKAADALLADDLGGDDVDRLGRVEDIVGERIQ